jgi:hypothetical protein
MPQQNYRKRNAETTHQNGAVNGKKVIVQKFLSKFRLFRRLEMNFQFISFILLVSC